MRGFANEYEPHEEEVKEKHWVNDQHSFLRASHAPKERN
jgi:hypothetical protein